MARRNPNWTAEEIVLATELLLKHDFRVVGEHHPDVRELSNLLNRLPIYSEERRNDEFRSPSSVDLKLANIRSTSPDWSGGDTNTSKLDDYFWRVLNGDAELLRYEADSIRAKYGALDARSGGFAPEASPVRSELLRTSRAPLDSLPVPHIHKERLQWFLDYEGATVTSRHINSISDPPLASRHTDIHRPDDWEHALSIKETFKSPHGDTPIRSLSNGGWVYRFHQEDNDHLGLNVSLEKCLRDHVPVGVLIQVQSKPVVRYLVAGLGIIQGFKAPWFEVVSWQSGQRTISEQTDRTSDGVSPSGESEGSHLPTFLEVATKETYSRQLTRPNQPLFRFMLLKSYSEKCAITGSRVIPVLEAAHIRPYSYERIDSIENGLLLRTDVHRLFDRGLIGVNTEQMETVVSPLLKGSEYEELSGKTLTLPKDSSHQPSSSYLDEHRQNWNLH